MEKAYSSVIKKVLWKVCRLHGEGRNLLGAVKAFYNSRQAIVTVTGEESEILRTNTRASQGCVKLPWPFTAHTIWIGR